MTAKTEWRRESVQLADYPIEVNDGYKRIALVNEPADAQLIAAAPDLLAAAEHLIEQYATVAAGECEDCAKARTAIAKARGR